MPRIAFEDFAPGAVVTYAGPTVSRDEIGDPRNAGAAGCRRHPHGLRERIIRGETIAFSDYVSRKARRAPATR
jgi:hypothetical protein